MALGALGLGGVAALPASAQEIPAPNLFDGQVACSMNVPTPPMSLVGQNMGGDDIGITAKIKSGMTIELDAMGVPANLNGNDDSGLANILYVIDPNLGNCGAGYVMNEDGDFLDSNNFATSNPAEYVAVAIESGIAADVGAGYSDALAKFMEADAADAAVKMAQDALDALPDTASAVQRAPLQTALDNALTAQTRAHTALYAAAEGPINMAGLAEWRAKAAVETAISGWNTAVTMADTARTAATEAVYNDKYVQIDSDQLLALVNDNGGGVNLGLLRAYANTDGANTGTQDAMDGTIEGDSAFDASGNLLIPMELWDHDSDDTTDQVLRVAAVDTATYMTVNDRLTAVNDVVKALETLQADNRNALLQPAIDEAVRRAKLEQGHYQAQYNTMIADDTDLREDSQKLRFVDTNNDGMNDNTETDANSEYVEEFSLKSLYEAYKAAETARDNAGVTLETAVQKREMATAAVRAAFTDPQSFYQQLVDRRSYEKSQKDAEVTRLAGLTGDDAPSAEDTADAAKAVTDAQAALEEAEEIQASFQDLLADDSPVADLVRETLKPDTGEGAGDDGGVLVDTIDDAFDAAAEAMTTAENAETAATEAGNAVAALTAVDDPATEDDETGAVTKNTNDITTINDTLSGLTGDEGQVGQNIKDIERNTTDIKTNTDNIATNATDIATNATDIATNATDIATNATDIATNATDIATNVTAIATNATDIATNATDIATNVTAIATNATDIATNATDIATNATDIATNVTAIATNVTGIMANAGNIMTNATNIMTNEAAITTNASDIITNAGHIAMNNTYMMANRGMIEGNASDIMAVRGMAQTNAAGISTNAANIHRNSESIDMLRAGVAASMALAGMPEIGDRGVSVGAGSYDGESALAVGVHFSGENSRFKLGVTSADGETGVSLGAGWSF